MNTTRLGMCIAILVALTAEPAAAGNILGKSGQTVFPENSSQRLGLTRLENTLVYGDWIETIDRATTTSSGVTITIVRKLNGLQNNSGAYAGRGMVELAISTNGATPGNKTIKLSGGIYGESTFTIVVAPSPTVSDVSVPKPADPFKEIVVTFTGTGLQEATDPALGKIVKDNLVNYITVGSDVMVSSVRVLSSSYGTLQVKIFLNGFVQDVSVDLSFNTTWNNNVPLTNGLKRRVRLVSSNVKNYVKSITFPNGNTFDKNSIATIRLNLLFPAPSDMGTTINLGGRSVTTNLSSGNTNRRIYLKLVPANAFVAVPNGTPLSSTGFTTVLANVGDDVISLTFKVADCLGGQPGTVNSVRIQTWMHNTSTNLPPDFVEQTFGVRCIQ